MKNSLYALAFVIGVMLMLAGAIPSAFGAGVSMPSSLPFESQGVMLRSGPIASNFLLSSTGYINTTGCGTAVDLGFAPKDHTITVFINGTTPTNVVVEIWGSAIGNNTTQATEGYGNISGSKTITYSPYMFHITDKKVRFLKACYVSRSGGDANTYIRTHALSGGI